MVCSQRATSFAVTGSTSTYVALDRYRIENSHDGAYTVSQSTTSPDGFANSLKFDITTADTSLAAGQFAQIAYRMEAQDLQDLAYGTSAAKAIVISFYVKSNKTGNYSFNIAQIDNSWKQVSFQYTINSADTWERKTISCAGDTSGVINDDNGRGFDLSWGLAYGSTYTSGSLRSAWTTYANGDLGPGQAVNLLDSTSNEFFITGIQIEVDHTGSGVATDFEHKPYAQELALCQRYFYAHSGGAHTVNGSDSSTPNSVLSTASCQSTSSISVAVPLPVPMRAVPSLYSTVAGSTRYRLNSSGANTNSGSDPVVWTAGSSHTTVQMDLAGFSGLSAGQAGTVRRYDGTGILGFNAEL